mgnify:CR=1 FL=1
MRTMSTSTLSVLRKLESVSADGQGIFLRREVRDFQELYYAGRESEITSLLFSWATIVFYASFLFTLSRFVALGSPLNEENKIEWEVVQVILDLSGFTTIFSILGATLATFHQWRQIRFLSTLHNRLGQGRKTDGRLQLVHYLTRSEQLLSFFRIAIALAGAVSLIWSLYLRIEAAEDAMDDDKNNVPVYVDLFAVVAGILTVVFFFVIELSVRDLGVRCQRIHSSVSL